MNKIPFLFSIAFFCSACQPTQTDKGNVECPDSTKSARSTVETVESKDSISVQESPSVEFNCGDIDEEYDGDLLAELLPEKRSENEEYVLLAEKLWRHHRMPNLEHELKWLHCVQESFTEAFDSDESRADALNNVQKADSMANVLYSFLADRKEDKTTLGMATSEKIKQSFSHYRLISAYDKLLKKNPEQRTEIEKWMTFEFNVDQFIGNSVILDYWGGSIVSVSLAASSANLVGARLSAIEDQLENNSREESVNVLEAKKKLVDAIVYHYESLKNSITEPEQKTYFDMLERFKESSITSLDEWLEYRNNHSLDSNTVALLKALTVLCRLEEY